MLISLYSIGGGCTDCNLGAMTWGTWMVAISLMLAPFWFNPLTFSVSKVREPGLSRGWTPTVQSHATTCRGLGWV